MAHPTEGSRLTLSEAVALRLEELMEERHLTQYRLYRLTGVAQSTIGDIRLQRNKSVSLLILHELVQGMGLTLYDFFDSPLFRENKVTD